MGDFARRQPSDRKLVIRSLTGFLYGSAPAEFGSAYSIDESVRRLSAATKSSSFKALANEAAVGVVTESKVSLQRSIPLVHNSFKPFFVGSFQRRGGEVMLSGVFRMHRAVQVFMTIWFGFCLFWTAASTIIATLADSRNPPLLPLFGLGMIAFGVALVSFGKWLSRNDIAWLSAAISNALAANAP
jgi:hypothetical protein